MATLTTTSQTGYSLTQCRWDWCTQSFATHAEMRDHVLQDHIAHAQPVRRGDVPILRRAEGENVRLSWAGWSASSVDSQSSLKASKDKETERVTHVEKATMTDNNDNPSLLLNTAMDDDDLDAEGDLELISPQNIITSEAVFFGSRSMAGPTLSIKENNVAQPSQRTALISPGAYSPSRARSRSRSPKFDQTSQTQPPSPPAAAPPSFTALGTETTPPPAMPPPSPGTTALVFGPRRAPPTDSGSPIPVKMDMSQDVMGSPSLTSGNAPVSSLNVSTLPSPILNSQWQAGASQLPFSSFGISAIDPSRLQIDRSSSGDSGQEEEDGGGGGGAKPPESHSTLEVRELSDSSGDKPSSSPAEWATSRDDDADGSLSPSQSQSLVEMPYSRGFGIGYGDNRATTPLLSQAPLAESYSWSSLT